MNRKLKALGLALFAAFAMTALYASAASAALHHITSTSKSGTTHLTAKADTDQKFFATTSDATREVNCKKINLKKGTATFTGTETTEITAGPEYSECTAKQGGESFSAKVTFGECHYLFTGETTTDVTGNQSATVHINCPEGKPGPVVDVTIFNLTCIEVTPNQTLEGVTYAKDETIGGAGKLTLDAKVHGIVSRTTGPCKGEGDPEEHTDGLYEGKATIEGFEDTEHKKAVSLGLKTTP
jgi:hypothetical protein